MSLRQSIVVLSLFLVVHSSGLRAGGPDDPSEIVGVSPTGGDDTDEKVTPPKKDDRTPKSAPADTKPNPAKPIDDRTSLTPPPPGADLFPPSGEKPKPPSGEPPLTVYEQRRRTAQEAERIRRENAARDAQNARLVQQRSLGHVESSGEYGEFVPDTVLIPVNRVSPELAQRLREVRRIAEDPRVPASLGNQAISLLLNIDPEFTNVGPIVIQAERVLEAGGARKYLTDSNPSSGQSKKEIVSVTRETTESTQTGKAYRQDDLLAKFPNLGTGSVTAKTGDVNVYVGSPKASETAPSENLPQATGKTAGLSPSLADALRQGLALRKEDGGDVAPVSGEGSRESSRRDISSVSNNRLADPNASQPRPRNLSSSSYSLRTITGGGVILFALLLALGVSIRRAAVQGKVSFSSVFTQVKALFLFSPSDRKKQPPTGHGLLIFALLSPAGFSWAQVAQPNHWEPLDPSSEKILMVLALIGVFALVRVVATWALHWREKKRPQGTLAQIPAGLSAGLFEELPPQVLRQVVGALPHSLRRRLLAGASDADIHAVLAELRPETLAALFRDLNLEYQQTVIESLPESLHQEILRTLPAGTVKYYQAALKAGASNSNQTPRQPAASKVSHIKIVK